MKLKCLKFFFSKFCGLLREDIDKSRHRHGVVKFLQGHIRSSFSNPPPRLRPAPLPTTVYRILLFRVPFFRFLQGPGSRFSCFLQGPTRVLGPAFPVFLGYRQGPTRVLGPGFSGFFRVPGPSFPVFLRSRQGPTRVPGPGFSVCRNF